MRVKSYGDKEGFVDFDISGLSGTVTSAILNLHVQEVMSTGGVNVSAMLAAWDEDQITHNNKPAHAPTPSAVFAVNSSDEGATIQIDVTSLVQQWASSPSTAYGIALTAANSNAHILFDTKEAGNAAFIDVTF
jgi:hypothetical protein